MEPELCTKMFKDLSEKFEAKFLVTKLGYSMAKIACLHYIISEVFEQEVSLVEGK